MLNQEAQLNTEPPLTSWGQLSKRQRAQVVGIKLNYPDAGWKRVAKMLGVPTFTTTCERKAREFVATQRGPSSLSVPEATQPDYVALAPRYNGDCMVMGDMELPRHDADAIRLALEFQKRFKFPCLILNGDTFVGDEFSSWAISTTFPRVTLQEEKVVGRQMFEALFNAFDEIHMINGNHDKRLARFMKGAMTYGDLLESVAPGVQFSEHAYMYVNDDWYVCHPMNYSINPLTVARKQCQKHLKHVICGHTHHLAHGRDPSGTFHLIDGGCMADPNRAAYKAASASNHPQWNPGFTMLLGGYPYLIDARHCDRDFWLR